MFYKDVCFFIRKFLYLYKVVLFLSDVSKEGQILCLSKQRNVLLKIESQLGEASPFGLPPFSEYRHSNEQKMKFYYNLVRENKIFTMVKITILQPEGENPCILFQYIRYCCWTTPRLQGWDDVIKRKTHKNNSLRSHSRIVMIPVDGRSVNSAKCSAKLLWNLSLLCTYEIAISCSVYSFAFLPQLPGKVTNGSCSSCRSREMKGKQGYLSCYEVAWDLL